MSETADSEPELVRGCLAGDRGAWERLVDGYAPIVLAVLRSCLDRLPSTGVRVEPEDLLQDVFVRLADPASSFLRRYDSRYRLSTWLGVLAREVAWHATRVSRPPCLDPGHVDRTFPSRVLGPDRLVESGESKARFDSAWQALSWKEQAALRGAFVEELDYRRIGEIVGLSPGSIGPFLSRAKSRFRQLFFEKADRNKTPAP